MEWDSGFPRPTLRGTSFQGGDRSVVLGFRAAAAFLDVNWLLELGSRSRQGGSSWRSQTLSTGRFPYLAKGPRVERSRLLRKGPKCLLCKPDVVGLGSPLFRRGQDSQLQMPTPASCDLIATRGQIAKGEGAVRARQSALNRACRSASSLRHGQ